MNIQESFRNEKATLFVVSTPIGNLSDITIRALEILKSVDVCLVEDSRKSGVLFKHYDIHTKMISYHEHNKIELLDSIVNMLEDKKNIALISDAGTPGISDPGYELIKRVSEEGYNVVSIPGVSAIMAALTSSGLLIQPFTFLGFLPRNTHQMEKILEAYKYRNETLVIYEAPLRIEETLKTIYKVLGNQKIALLREITKIFETIIRGYLETIIQQPFNTLGEYVIVIELANTKDSFKDMSIEKHMMFYLKEGYSEKEAMKCVATDRRVSKSVIYDAYKGKNSN